MRLKVDCTSNLRVVITAEVGLDGLLLLLELMASRAVMPLNQMSRRGRDRRRVDCGSGRVVHANDAVVGVGEDVLNSLARRVLKRARYHNML